MAKVQHTCTGCVPIDASIIEAYVALVNTNEGAKAAEALRVAAEESRVEAEEDRVEAENARVVSENARAAEEDLREGAEDERAAAETARETAEAARVAAEALRVSAEDSRESAEAARAAQASADHTVAASDHTQAAADHTQATANHTAAEADHTQAGADHERAEGDHSTADADHTQAAADHAVMEGYDSRLSEVENSILPVDFSRDNYYINLAGQVDETTANTKCTNPVRVEPGEKFYFSGWYTSGLHNVWGYADANYGTPTPLLASGQTYVDEEITIPNGVNYIVAWGSGSPDRQPLKLYKEGNLQNQIDETNTRITNTEIKLSSDTHDAFDFKSPLGYYLNAYGSYTTTSIDSVVSGFFAVKPGDVVIYSGRFGGCTLSLVWGYAGMDESGATPLLADGEYSNTEVTIPDGVNYVRAWSLWNTPVVSLLKKGAVAEGVATLKKTSATLVSDVDDLKATTEPLPELEIIIGYNIFKGEVISGYLDGNGRRSDFASGIVTKYLAVSPGEQWYYKGGWDDQPTLGCVWGYTNTSGAGAVKLVPCLTNVDTLFVIPSGIAYIRAWGAINKNPVLYNASSIVPSVETLKKNSFEKVVVSSNLFNKETVTEGYYISYSTGQLSTLDGYWASDYIPIKPSTYYVMNHDQQVAFYDEYKVYVSGIASPSGAFQSPAIAKFIRICGSDTLRDVWALNESQVALPYEPYMEGYKDFYLPSTSLISSIRYTTIIAERNEDDYNSIRDIIADITDASPDKPYIVFVPKGRWFECDLSGKPYVSIVGEDREETIIYCDGTSENVTPDNYAYPAEKNKPLNTIHMVYKHAFFLRADTDVKNLTIEVNDAKYCAHVDDRGYTSVKFTNCHFIAKQNVNYPVGIGISGGQSISIEKSIIERVDPQNLGVFAHNWNNQSKPSAINITDCYFKNCGFICIDELGSEQEDAWNLLNCYSDVGGAINAMVDANGDGKTYWVNPSTGENETNPQNVPYCIKLNCCGSNVGKIQKNRFASTTTVARPDILKYIIADCILAIDGTYNIDGHLCGYVSGNSAVIGENNNTTLPFLGVVDSIVGGKCYVIKKGHTIIVSIDNIYGSGAGIGNLVYRRDNGYLTTAQAQSMDNTPVGIIWGDYYGVGRQIVLF